MRITVTKGPEGPQLVLQPESEADQDQLRRVRAETAILRVQIQQAEQWPDQMKAGEIFLLASFKQSGYQVMP